MPAMVEYLGMKNIEGINVMNIIQHDNRITVVSTYTKTVLILVTVQISVSFVIIMLSSLLKMIVQESGQWIAFTIAGLIILIASVIALLIAFVKKINENYPLNVALVIIYYYTIGVLIGTQILMFIVTIFLSYSTVGKSRYLFFYPNYALASIFLYTVFFLTSSINTDIINANKTNSSIFQFQITEH
ncbi:unnamed protein product [Schistosoma intercalatum]|nr:unnamed protein product [Schistosoma intercalatum]